MSHNAGIIEVGYVFLLAVAREAAFIRIFPAQWVK
jgi:hypothetical protein